MAPKALSKIIKLENIVLQDAIIIKQELSRQWGIIMRGQWNIIIRATSNGQKTVKSRTLFFSKSSAVGGEEEKNKVPNRTDTYGMVWYERCIQMVPYDI